MTGSMLRKLCISILIITVLFSGCDPGGQKGEGDNEPTSALFLLEKREYATGEAITFKNRSTGAFSYHWDFGDGTTSTEQSPEHMYKLPGEYVPQLTVTRASNTSSYDYKITVSGDPISGEGEGIAGGTGATDDEGESGQAEGEDETPGVPVPAGPPATPVQMTLTPFKVSTGAGLKYSHPSAHRLTWEFGPGQTSSSKSGKHTYSDPGKKLVKLTWMGDGQRVVLDSQIIQVFRASVTPTKVNVESEITLKAEADFGMQWDLGEGEILNEHEATLAVNVPGNMTIKLKDAQTGNTLQRFQIKVNDIMRSEKIDALLLELADPGRTRQDKNGFAKELESYCVQGRDTPVTGVEAENVDELVMKIRIESSEFTATTIKTEIALDDAGKITGIKVLEYTKKNI